MFLEEKANFFGNKTVDQRSGANSKILFFAKNLLQISCFFQDFCSKNAENDYFDQHLDCAAPKRWSKYTSPTTPIFLINSEIIGLTNAPLTNSIF